ncbi:MAG: hypothetical protein KQH63_20325 [Desulfobulbaceae bacterium]|nr:hypothetical protein [Desulfobulbaceae bacterium]
MKDRAVAKKKTQTTSKEQVEFEAMMGTLGTMGSIPALIGLWAAASFVGGLIESGGPLSMASQFFSALTGI